ncbi:MAG TPA: ELWxxDGT repeat protein [Bacteroidia bacterium]
MKKTSLLYSAFICLLLLFNTESISGQTALVKDIEPGANNSMSSSYFVTMGSAAYFVAYTSTNSYELWKTDATTGGTTLVKDINAGTGNANPSSMFVNGTTLYFLADNGTNGKELWKSDGTTAGTMLVKDIATGTAQGVYNYSFFAAIGSTIFFIADAGTTGYELWKSDGTTAGTVLVKDIYAGTSGGFTGVNYATVIGSTLYFTATDGTNGTELWKSDGTSAGTVMVKDIYAGATSSSPENFCVMGSTLYFTASTSANGKELWKSDGTAAGTMLVKDIYSGTTSSNPIYFTALGSTLYFRATDATTGTELWKSDGTTAGTVVVKDIYSGTSSGYPNYITIFGSTLYFTATTSAEGDELWKSDGTTAGTTLVKDIYTGSSSSNANNFTVVGSRMYFSASTAANGNELWKTDGTTAGTTLVRDINPGTGGSSPTSLANMNGVLYFSAYLNQAGNIFGYEPFTSDGTTAGTLLLEDMVVGQYSSSPENFLYLNSTILFTANADSYGTELFKITSGYHKKAYFTGSPTTVYSSSPINFANFTDQTPNDPTSWSWTFTGGTPSTSTAQNPTNIVYNTPGCYQVSLTTTFASGNDNETKTCYIQVNDINTAYCPAGGSGTTNFYYVNGVQLGSINNSNTGSSSGPSYQNYLAQSTTLNRGQTYTLTINGAGGSDATYAAWIDYNRDGVFDESTETAGQVSGFMNSAATRTIVFTVPAGTYLGTTRMRVRVADDIFMSSHEWLEPCGNGQWQDGETEDYSITLAGGLAPVANFSASNTSPNAGTSINFTDLSTNTPTSWSWSFAGGSPATSTAQNPTNILYSTPGCYQVTLTATNIYGSDPEVKTCYINVLNPALAPVADFVASNTSVAVGGSLNFTDLTANSPTSWSWSFQGGSPATSTSQNPTNITYSTAGVYSVTLTATNANGSDQEIKTSYITVQSYCTPSSGGSGTSAGDYIKRAQAFSLDLGTVLLDNVTTGGAQYKNYTSTSIPLKRGEQYGLSAEGISPNGSPNSYGAFFIDWNHDGDFADTGERVYEALLSGFDLTPWSWSTGVLTVPANAALGATRIRYRIVRPSGANVDPCAVYQYGETEDYTVYISPAAGSAPPVADFSASSTNITVGGNTSFTDLSTNNPTSWSWSFTGGTPASSTAQNPTGITYPTAGCYQVTLTATNASGSDQEIKTCYINVTASSGSYCAVSSSTGTTEGDFIDGVTLGSINNMNTGSMGGPFYNNYTTMSTNLARTSTYTVNVKSGTWPAGYADYYAVWIDYNHDSDFSDAGEKLGEFTSTAPSTTQSIVFTVPATATTGSTRMRVRGVWETATGIDPCAAYVYGETEDYSVNITAATGSAPVANFSASSTSINVGGSVNFTDLSTNNPTSWSWSFTGGTPATSTAQNPTGITYSVAGCYQVTLTATNAFGSDPEVRTCYINVTAVSGSYCSITTSNYGTSDGDFIDAVTLGSINNSNSGSVGGAFYNNYTTMSTNLVKSNTYTINIRSGTWPGTYADYYAVWIDYNHDFDFADANEKLGEFVSSAPSTTQGITFTVPAAATTGSTRMRVRGVWVTASGVDPCLSYDYGETEDYSVNITNAVSLADISSGSNIQLFPNPTNGEITLEVNDTQNSSIHYSIMNAIGQEIGKKEMTAQSEKIDLSNYPAGIYFIHITIGQGTVIKKIMKQ